MTREEKAAHWGEVVEQQEQSGLSVAAFCREADLPAWQFHYWRRRLRETEEAEAESGFVSVACAEDGQTSGVWIRRGDCEVIVERDFDETTLLRVLRALGC